MTDNQLLFEAAKAAGIDFSIKGQVPTRFDGKDFIVWNPLTNDGDALRLAVKLGIKSKFNSALNQAIAWCGYQQQDIHINVEDYNNDPYAATRRAIVRAAAEIGKEMK
jgi:hypothetical protein